MIKRLASIALVVGCVGLVIAFVPATAIVDKAFATARGAFTDDATTSQSQAQRSCDDLEFWFLNGGGCSTARVKHAARTKHHVASYLAGHPVNADFVSARH